MRPGSTALLAGLMALASATSARPQTGVSARFGENADAATGISSGPAFSLSVTHLVRPGGLTVGLGTPTDPTGGSRWASAAAWLDHPLRLSGIGLTGTAEAFGYHDPVLDATGGAASLNMQAYRDFDAGPVRVRLRAGGRAGMLTSAAGSFRRAIVGGGSDATVAAGPLVLRASAEAWRAEERTYPGISATAVLSWRRLTAHARVSRWVDRDFAETGWSAAAEVAVTDRLSLTAHAAEPTADILFFTPPLRSWSVGLRYGMGSPPPAALPAPVFAEPGERIRLEVAASEYGDGAPIRIAGGFNGWTPAPMRRDGVHWVAELRLEPGVHEYAFVAPDGSWFVPEGTPGRKPDGFGGFVATIVVR